MANELTVTQILQIKNICQYLSLNAIQKATFFKGGPLDSRVARMIYVEGKSVQIRYNQNPSDPTLPATSNYLYSLLGRWALEAQTILNNLSVALPVIFGPASQTVNVGANATFSATVSSSVPYTVQWYDMNNNAIPGATTTTYVFTNAQLTDNNKTFYVKATNSAGTTTSVTATLIVNVALVGYYYFGATDYSTQLEALSDTVPYVGTFAITTGQPLTILLPSGAANQFMVFKYPATESIKSHYSNLPINVGIIPSIAWNAVLTFGGWNYIFTRTGHTFGLNSVNPIVFS